MILKNGCMTLNTILYCKNWKETLRFYRVLFDSPGDPLKDWFVEFSINATARISVADEKHASIKSANGKGITLSIQIEDIERQWDRLHRSGLAPNEIRVHSWGAKVFYLFDPEGHRVEMWTSHHL
jgi:predicted enzyme related to lactoylglutathione lyase